MTFWVSEENPTARVSKIFFPAKDNTVILSFNDDLCHNYSAMEAENTDRQCEKHRYICALIKLYFQKEGGRFIGPHAVAAQPLSLPRFWAIQSPTHT